MTRTELTSSLLIAVGLLVGCASERPFTKTDIVWTDDDRHPIEKPEEYWSSMYWDAADQTVFRPLSHAFLLEESPPAQNVNALEEVPNSSWYTNRMSLRQLSPEEVANGPCEEPEIDGSPDTTWWVKSGKVGGANPGFVVEDSSSGKTYLLKFDQGKWLERATAADVIGSKIYWAAGFSTPCNRVIYFEQTKLELAEGATKKDPLGRKTPMTMTDVELAMAEVARSADGRIRGSASLFLLGEPLGPFTYEGTRDDDPNDVIPHEDRRELRGSRLLAAWLNHFDSREQNTFTSFIRAEGSELGYVQHHILDWGDCLGSRWDWDAMSRRFGHSYYLDIGHVLGDVFTLGLIERPWEQATTYEAGDIFGYYDVANFEPEEWKPGYPNVAFSRMDDGDAFWMTKIISRFSDDHIAELVKEGRFSDEADARYLERVLMGRRDRIVRHYFEKMSPFARLRIVGRRICMDDLIVTGGYGDFRDAFYEWRLRNGTEWRPPSRSSPDGICIEMEDIGARGDYLEVEVRVRRTHQANPARPTVVHLLEEDGAFRLVGVER